MLIGRIIIDESPTDRELYQKLQVCDFTMEKLEFPEELQDEQLWIEPIQIFDKFQAVETPLEKLNILLRTLRLCSQIFQLANHKAS